ncbi:hypothetical protein PJE062_3986 [Pseudovibrio sp. JE062]|nr:hypothetical protein PJE062_3986 [Pseudovibrio sp. JE062]
MRAKLGARREYEQGKKGVIPARASFGRSAPFSVFSRQHNL